MIRSLPFAIALLVTAPAPLAWMPGAGAHDLTREECTQGGEFIRNAALARDAGITREFFVNRLAEDLVLIRAFPPQLRWFVQDESDEKLLSGAVFEVFDAPRSAFEHETEFIGTCMQAVAATADGAI